MEKDVWQHRLTDALEFLVRTMEGARADGFLFEFSVGRDPTGRHFIPVARIIDFNKPTALSADAA